MSAILYRCRTCNLDQAISTSAVEVVHEAGLWIARCVCPDDGEATNVRIDSVMASSIIYWQTADRIAAAQSRAYAYAGDEDEIDRQAASIPVEVEAFLRAREGTA